MLSVCLIPPAPNDGGFDHLREDCRILSESASSAPDLARLVNDPEQADLVVFVGSREPFQRDLRRHPMFRSNRRRCFVYDSGDAATPYLPGIYPSIERRHYRPRRTRSGSYLRWSDSPAIDCHTPSADVPYLFSFVGASVTHPIRGAVLRLRHPRSWVEDTTGSLGKAFASPSEEELGNVLSVPESHLVHLESLEAPRELQQGSQGIGRGFEGMHRCSRECMQRKLGELAPIGTDIYHQGDLPAN